MRKVLTVYFSRSGNTRRVAEAMARSAGWDVEPIREQRSRAGLWGWLRSGYEATSGRTVPIEPMEHDPADYDLVVVGTPVWNSRVSSPVRTFLSQQHQKIREAAFLVTCGGRGADGAIRQMASLVGNHPRLSIVLTARDLAATDLGERIRRFIAQIDSACEEREAFLAERPAPSLR
jgi:hypothetical protein